MIVKCFLCRKEAKTPDSETNDPLKTLDSCVTLSKQLRVIFILKNVLDSPTQQLETYLQRFGNPEEWDVKLCSKCSEDVDKIQELFLQLKTTYKLYEDARLKVKKRVYEINIGKEGGIKTENHDHDDHVNDYNVSTSSWNWDTLLESSCDFGDHHDEPLDSTEKRNEVPEVVEGSRRRCQRDQNPLPRSVYFDGGADDNDDDVDYSVASEQQVDKYGKRKYPARRTRTTKSIVENGIRKYICRYEGCDKTYLDLRNYRTHVLKHEKGDPKFECSDCGKRFYIRRNLYIHRRRTHKKTTPSTAELLKNYKAPEGEKQEQTGENSPAPNTEPPQKKTKKRSYEEYIITLNDIQMFQCNFEGCTKTFRERRRFAAHMAKHEGVPPHIPCLDCGECFYLHNDLSQHRAKKHGPKDPAGNLCHKCGKDFGNPYQLKCHVRRCGVQRHRCTKCHERFMTVKGLERHGLICSWTLKAKEIGSEKAKWECELCNKEYSTEKSYKNHLAYVHKGPPEHVCDVCGYKAKLRRELLRHQANLHNLGEFKCRREGCGKTFYRGVDLEDHEKYVHLGVEKPRKYVCTYCGKGFTMSQGLRLHVEALHTKREIKPWKCEICGKGFAIQTHLISHRKKTHKKDRIIN